MHKTTLSHIGRLQATYVVVTGVFVLFFVGLIKLQIFEHSELATLAENNRIRVVPIEPRRGVVFDRQGRVIVGDRPSYTVSVVPAEERKGLTIPHLAPILDLDTTQIRRRVKRNAASPYQPAPIRRDVPFDAIAVLEEQNSEFPGVNYQLDRVREYSVDLRAEAFTGHVGEVSEQEMERNPQADYRLGSTIGKKGVEKQYDDLLRGVEGTAFIEVTALGEVLGEYKGKERVPPVPGCDLTLSIDNDVQLAAIQALDTQDQKFSNMKLQSDSAPIIHRAGAIVAIDPRTGEILAMTSAPGFDPNTFSGMITDSMWQAISTDPAHPLLNRPLAGLYPPGSTFKLLTLGAGLESGVIDENTTFRPCLGGYQFGNRFFKCWEKRGHGVQNSIHAVEMSCDAYFYQLGLKVGVDQMYRYAMLCGFGKKTGVDLPSELSGLMPSVQYYDKRYGKNGWTKALVLNTAIGQGEVLTTPLQLAQFYCGIANWGTVYKPHLVTKVTHPNGRVDQIEPQVSFQLPFSRSTLAIMREGLRLVVEGGSGTARRLRNNLYSVCGKTGTAQNPHGEDHSWFVGFAPIENPEIVVCALVENAGHGSEVAAPVAKKVIEVYMKKKLGLLEPQQQPEPMAQVGAKELRP
ncbi:penicillin-binding protein 2 [candidate division GN15 bacterium]|uniref:Penicillin-binding protein 2 n=1 Tax=candidate division GN15 bacterium TaxID=2072418 RepID=A0A855X1V9_9BACT|nr:MAG: penicillin-binding protein 2 [candidate division GN15 bacterium]